MTLTQEEKSLLSEVIDKHIVFVASTRRSVLSSRMKNERKMNDLNNKIANLNNIKLKIEAM